MKCSNCGFINASGSEFCGNCGNKLNNVSTNNLPVQKKKNKSIIFIILGIILVIIIAVIVISIFSKKEDDNFEDPFKDIEDFEVITDNVSKGLDIEQEENKLESDYNNNLISSDEYILQIAYSLYDSSKVKEKYNNASKLYNEPHYLMEKIEELYDKLSDETKIYLFNKLTLGDVVWDVDEESEENASNLNSKNEKNQIKYLENTHDVSSLNSVILSENKHFLVYYSTKGKNAIKKDTALEIASFLENIVSTYKTKYDLDFKYDAHMSNGIQIIGPAWEKATRLLMLNQIDSKYLDTAMPVYIVDTDVENTSALGFYTPYEYLLERISHILPLFSDDATSLITASAYAFPFFVVSSTLDDFDDTKIVLAHELFHHYQRYICGEGKYKACKSGNFTLETVADLAASQILSMNNSTTILNSHASMYSEDTESSIDKVGELKYGEQGGGYGAFVFANNYSDIIKNGINNWIESLKTETPLQYLYDEAGDKYKDVFIKTAESNLKQDFKNKLLKSSYMNKSGEILTVIPKNHKDINLEKSSKNEKINYSSMHYYYINPKDYEEKAQLTFNGSSKDLTLLIFLKSSNSYNKVYEYTLNKEFVVNPEEFDAYDEAVFVIINSSLDNLTYSYELVDNGTKTPTITASDLNIKKLEDLVNNSNYLSCHMVEDDSEYSTITQIKISYDKSDKINDMYLKATLKIKNYEEDKEVYDFSKSIVSGIIYIMQATYEKQLKYFKVRTEEEDDEFSLIFKVTKDFNNALSNSLNMKYVSKYELAKDFLNDGYTCNFSDENI